jgi:hypothetical protein
MSDEPTDKADRSPESPGLDKTIQESIGQKLRSAYNQIADKPAYLGDPVLPPAMEDQITRLGTKIRANEQGVAAVADALNTDALNETPDSAQNNAQAGPDAGAPQGAADKQNPNKSG